LWTVAAKRLISDDIAGFLESGLSINVGTCDDDLQPDGAVAWAARVHDDRAHLTLFMHKEAAQAMLRNLTVHPEIAIAFDCPPTHRACQVKGRFVSTRAGKPAERTEVERQVDHFGADLEAIGIPRAMVAGWKVWPCVALEVRVTELFEQTPGPGTGEPLR
jgi:hypothetical protein